MIRTLTDTAIAAVVLGGLWWLSGFLVVVP